MKNIITKLFPQSMNISDSQKRYLSIISFALVAVWLLYSFIHYKDNFWNLTTLVFGLTGVLFTVEDKRNAKIVKAFDDISKSIGEVKTELKTQMQDRDSGHDQKLTELTTKLAFVEHKLELHSEQFGHPEMVKELYRTNEKISDLNANVAMLTKQGKIDYQLNKVEADNKKLALIIQDLIAAQSSFQIRDTGVLQG